MLHIVMSKAGMDVCRKFFNAEQDEIFFMFASFDGAQNFAQGAQGRVHFSNIVSPKGDSSALLASLIESNQGKTITWY